jgi:hypothetical protein
MNKQGMEDPGDRTCVGRYGDGRFGQKKEKHWPDPVRPFKFARFEHVKHYKGGTYEIVGLPDEYVIEETREPAYAYRSVTHDSPLKIIRSQSKMEDGRFTTVPSHHDRPQEPAGHTDLPPAS